ncbi:MAG: LacI family transcriptional regulator [Betaproteobacteria bacterium]|nr:MAG: LacI family transcriptional regulator [Betaproteobacteria bacterium]
MAMYAGILTACESRLAHFAYGVMLITTGGRPEQNLLATHALLGRGAQAVVFAEVGASTEIARALEAHGVPWVSLGENAGAAGAPSLSIGRPEGAVLAARYLLSLGHRRVAVIARPDGDVVDAVKQVVAAGSRSLEVLDARLEIDAVQAAMGRWLERDELPTAVISDSDVQALAALRECAIRDIAVPQRLSVIGFGDAELARRTYPTLSTVRVATAELGSRVAEAVVAGLKEDKSPAPEVSVKLIVRESTGPAFA